MKLMMNKIKFLFGMTLAILRYLIVGAIVWWGKVAVWIFAPFFALFVQKREESEVTGFPSLYPGMKRDFLIDFFMWAQTHDAPVDEFWYAGYYKGNHTQHYYDSNILFRYWMRVQWLWRNPAYVLAERLGYDNTYTEIVCVRGNDVYRKKVTDFECWIVKNSAGKYGFQIQGQINYNNKRYFEFRLGYALFRKSPIRHKGMVYVRLLPFRKYDR